MAVPASDSAFMTDPQFSFVEDATSRSIGTVNMITCFMGAMAPDQMVNEGEYIALIDEAKCDTSTRSSTSNASSTNTGANAAAYTTVVVDSSRSSNDEPMLTRAWFEQAEEGNSLTIFIRSEANEGPSESNPYGDFRMDFCGRPDGEFSDFGCFFKGFLEAGSEGITFFQHEDTPDHRGTTALRMAASGESAGSGRLYSEEESGGGGGSSTSEFSFAYDDEHFLRGDECFSRDANEAKMSVWRYGVYDADTGARFEINSGFPIEYTPPASSIKYHGYLGYHGLHLPSEAAAALANDEDPRVEQVTYSSGENPERTSYSIFQAGGKLYKYTRQERTLAQMDGVKFTVFIGTNASSFFSGALDFKQYEAYWDDETATLKVTGLQSCGQNGCQVSGLEQEADANLAYFADQGGLRGWSQSLGGELFIDLSGVGEVPDSVNIDVVYRVQDLVYPNEMPETLYCINDCPTAALVAAFFGQTQGNPVQSPMEQFNNWMPTVANDVMSYTTAEGLLIDEDAAPVLLEDDSTLDTYPQSQYMHGLRSGRLFETLADAECAPDSQTYCDFKIHNLETYYIWETGPNSWNQFAAARDGDGNFVEFDPPQQFEYTVPPDSERYGRYAGQQIVLEYAGFGNLWGLPGECVSNETNETVECGPDTRYVPAFAIPGGEIITQGETEYFVKWLDREIRFKREDDVSACSGLSLPTEEDIALPDISGFNDPSDAENEGHYIGAKPVLDKEPRVIHGDVMY